MKYGETFDTEYGKMVVTYRAIDSDIRPDEVLIEFDIRGDLKQLIFLNDSIVPPFTDEEAAVEWYKERAIEHIAHNIYFNRGDDVRIFPVTI